MELDAICHRIATADSTELSAITRHVVQRYGELFENEEIVFLSLPKHDGLQRQQIIEAVLRLEQLHKNQIKNPE